MIKYHDNVKQGGDEWLEMRCGLLTASEMKLIISPKKLAPPSNNKERAHVSEIAAQRITKYVEPSYVSDDMLRGLEDEITARDLYSKHYAAVKEVGFITNDKWGFTLGYSPDGIVGDDGLIEVKSRRQKYQIDFLSKMIVPDEFMIQIQTGLLVSERPWLDFISYSGGLPILPLRVLPDFKVQEAIIRAAQAFESNVQEKITQYSTLISSTSVIQTERKEIENDGELI